MKQLLKGLKVEVNPKVYVKDPESSDLGKKIIEQSILLINEIGFDNFTFKKLGGEIGSNESSIYRYFENKHKLLLYLMAWYWGRNEYRLVFATANIPDPEKQLEIAIEVLTQGMEKEEGFSHIDEGLLHRIVVNEYSKSYLTKDVDKENEEGFFATYHNLVIRLRDMILAVKPDFPFAASLASTILEGSLHQHFLKEHLPDLTECNDRTCPSAYFQHLVFSTLKMNL